MRNIWICHILLVPLLLIGCATTTAEDYVSVSASNRASVSLGRDSEGKDCLQQTRPGGELLVYCGDASQPSARVRTSMPSGDAVALADASPWRTALEGSFSCQSAVATTLYGAPAATLQCARRQEGIEHRGLVVVTGDAAYFGDADTSAWDVLQRAIGVKLGKASPESAASLAVDPNLTAQRDAYQAASSRDIHDYDGLMVAGVRANLTENYAGAEAAFRQAASLLDADNPARADPLTHQALQLSNLGRYSESEAVFRQAEDAIRQGNEQARKAGKAQAVDPALEPQLALYRALDMLNQQHPSDALPLLDRAEQRFTAIIPADERSAHETVSVARTGGTEAMIAGLADAQVFQDPITASAILGLISTRRARAVAFLMLKRLDDSAAQAAAAAALAAQHGMAQAALESRIIRTTAMIDAARGDQAQSIALLGQSVAAFRVAFSDSRPLAETELLRAGELLKAGQVDAGGESCRLAIDVLGRLKAERVDPALMMPCLDAFAAIGAAATSPDAVQDAYTRMFAAAQLAQSSVTSAQIAQAAARLVETQRDSGAGLAIRQSDEAQATLNQLLSRRNLVDQQQRNGQPTSQEAVAALDADIRKAETSLNRALADVQEAAPNYGQLIQQVVTPKDVFALLHPGEALAAMVLGPDHGWTLLLRDGRIAVARIDGGLPRMQTLVNQIRASVLPGPDGVPPPFATGPAQELYDATLRGTAGLLHGTTALVIAPSGPLLSIPFGLLLTGPAGDDLARAPWLIQQMTIAHVPASANFVLLRRAEGTRKPTRPWIGFGDPQPVTLQQATASFPAARCADSARLLSSLGLLQGTRAELNQARTLLDPTARGDQDEIVGDAFTMKAVVDAPLDQYGVVHFATHGLLPTDLACQNEAAIVTSPAPNARDASSALLTASAIDRLKLTNAETVILSACNTAGPNGQTSGESLSGLARSFFYAGAGSLLATHWAVNDQVTTILVAGTLRNDRLSQAAGLSAALAAEQRDLLRQATNPTLAELAHPYYWAPLALIGDGGGMKTTSAGSRPTLAGL